jgi:hypothetical protein
MKLYVWRSLYLANWAPGYMMAVAQSPEEAKQRIMEEFERHYWEGWRNKEDPEDQEEFLKQRETTEEDLQALPEEVEVLFILGSD